MVNALTPKQRSAIERALRLPELQPLLFNKARGISWLMGFFEAGFFNPDLLPAPVKAKQEGYISVPAWPAVGYLLNIATELGHPENLDSAQLVLDFIRNCFHSAKRRSLKNYRVWWQFSKILAALPPQLLQRQDVDMLDDWLEDPHDHGLVAEVAGEQILPSLFALNTDTSRDCSLALLESLYRIELTPGRKNTLDERQKADLRFDSWHAEKITKAIARLAGEKLGKPAIGIFLKVLIQSLDALENDSWSYIWRPAIEDHEQNAGRDDAQQILTTALRDSILGFIKAAPAAEQVEVVNGLLDSEYQLLHRIAIYAVDANYESLGDLATRCIESSQLKYEYRHELWNLMRHHFGHFSQQLKASVLQMASRPDDEDNVGSMHREAAWLSAIQNFDAALASRYAELVSLLGAAPDHPEFSAYMSSGWVNDESPIDPVDLQRMSTEDLIAKLNGFQDTGSFSGPNKRGLAKAFKALVSAAPHRFAGQFRRLLELNLAYVYEFLDAYRELWEARATLPWDETWRELFDLVELLIETDRFWSLESSEEQTSFVGNRHWVVGEIARLIEAGCTSDDHAFSPALLPKAHSICVRMLSREEGENFERFTDAVSTAINSPRGRTIEALIHLASYACRLARRESGSTNDAWMKYEPTFETELAYRGSHGYEFATLVTCMLPRFLFMSKDWVVKNMSVIFDIEDKKLWLCAIQGYSHVSTVYEEVYRYLSSTNQLFAALDEPTLASRSTRTFVQQIVVAYLNDFESLDNSDSAISRLLARQRPTELVELIWFIWTLRPEKRQDKNPIDERKVFALWRRLLTHIDFETADGRKIASHLCDWIAFVEHIDDETRKLLEPVLPLSSEDFRTYELLSSIARLSATQPNEAAMLWLRMLTVSNFDFPEEAVRDALRNISSSSAAGVLLAKKVADAYLRSGNEQPSKILREMLDTPVG